MTDTPTVGASANLWQATEATEATEATGAPGPDAPPLAGDVTADVAIIGGGYTGCVAALRLAEGGAKVHLLEAESLGHGGSGRNVGLVNAGLWAPPETVERHLGGTAGARLNAALGVGPDLVFSLIEKHAIACEAMRNGTLHCAHSPAGLRDLEDRLRQQRARVAPVELLDAAETARRTGTGRFHGALLDRRAGTIQPLGYLRGLARVAQAAGASLHEKSPVITCKYTNNRWQVETPGGTVTARRLIRATNAYPPPVPGIATPRFTPVHYFQVATAPLDEAIRRSILPGGEGCWDTARVMTSFRLDAAGRLILGAVGRLAGAGGAVHRGWAQRMLAALYPGAAESAAIDHAWHGRIAMTADHLPRVERLGPGAVTIYGYSGRGIAPGTVFGAAAADWVLTDDETAFPVRPVEPRDERWTGLRARIFEAGAVASHLSGAR